ncbi:MAG: AbrB family transcriptional regulator [Rhodobacteraceae bacterium]|nr:AbrB family transcriptional regulator [Paracoccaceae bacterium]
MSVLSRPRLTALVAAALGAAVAILVDMPLPLMLGPMLACLVFALAGARLQDVGILGTLMRTVLGVAIGSTITPQLLHDLPAYGPTLAAIPAFIVVMGGLGYLFFRRFYDFDHPTAFYSAMPGGLQDMLIFGSEAGGDVRAISLIHATRVLILVVLAPFAITHWFGLDLTGAPGAPARDLPPHEIAIMVVAGLVGWKVAARLKLFGASIIGPMILTAILSLTDVIHSRPPAEMILAAQFFIGLSIGAQYTGITTRELRVDVGAGLALSALLMVLSAGAIATLLVVSSKAPLDIILAFLPGGQAEMTVLAIVAGADVAFVVAHHLARISLIILLAPVVARLVARE